MTKRWIMGLGFLAAAALTACGQKEGITAEASLGQGAQASENGDSSEEITFCWWGGDSRHEATEKAVEAFMKKYPEIKVTTEYGAWSGWEQKQSLALSSGTAPDLMQINWNWIDNYGKNGTTFLDLNQFSDIIDLTQFPEEVLEQCMAES